MKRWSHKTDRARRIDNWIGRWGWLAFTVAAIAGMLIAAVCGCSPNYEASHDPVMWDENINLNEYEITTFEDGWFQYTPKVIATAEFKIICEKTTAETTCTIPDWDEIEAGLDEPW
jgi:hypothetical protein